MYMQLGKLKSWSSWLEQLSKIWGLKEEEGREIKDKETLN